MAARCLAGPTSRRPCRRADLEEALSQRCPVSEDTQQDLERCIVTKRSSMVVEIVDDEVVGVTSILNAWSVETTRYLTWLQRVWQSHSRHDDLRKVSRQRAPKHPEILGRAIRHASHREAFNLDVKSWVPRTGWQGYK
jgi:hypothetical protein